MAEYFKVDGRKITLREYWNITRSWKALIPWVAGRLNISMALASGFRHFEDIRELEIAESDFLPQARAKLQPLLEQCLQMGFHSPRYFSYETIRRDVRTSFISLLHRSGEFALRLMHTLGTKVTPPKETQLVVLLSELNDGTFFFTSNQRPTFKGPPGVLVNRLVGANLIQLVESHQQHLAKLAARNPPRPVQSQPALDEVWNRYEKMTRDYQVGRGVYVQMPPEEAEGQQKLNEAIQTMASGGVPHADVLVELNQLQNKKGGWGNAILILLVSLLVFVGTGSKRWSWDYVLMLVPVLFVHELGHYLAMRAFHYRNLRMFFIPFFGAAVAGQHYNVPGWKKVIVSMMGPAPGILLGVIVGGTGLVLHQPWLIKVALVALILNGFNLLPVLPLDGGWIFHALLFSRHHLLDATFRVLAAVALVMGGIATDNKVLMYLGIVMLLGIPMAYRMARITSVLRQRGVPPGSPDDQTIPTETAVAIIDELKKSLPKGHTNKMVAQQTLQTFETLNARPPGWAATIGLLFAYLTSLGMAVVFAGVFVAARRGDLDALLTSGATEPRRALACDAAWSWQGAQVAAAPRPVPITLIAHFGRRVEAERSFHGLTNRVPASATLRAFGDSLLLALPSGEAGLRKQWYAELQRQTKLVFVESSNAATMLSISCQFATVQQAKELEDELREYFSTDLTRSLIPPWYPEDRRTADQRAANRLARKSQLKAQASRFEGYDAPKMRSLQKQLNEAQRQADDAEVVALRKQMENLSVDFARARLEKLKAGEDGPVDPAVIDLVASLSAGDAATNGDAKRTVMREIAKRMGQLPSLDGAVDSLDDRFSTRAGMVSRRGRTLQLSWVSFTRISDGAPALLGWLCIKGGVDFKYDILPGTGLGSDDEP